jgi:hypothetical protein
MQFSTTIRNDWLDRYEVQIGTSPKMRFYTGSPPANCAAAATGTQLVEIPLPSDWMAAAASGSKAKSGTWSATASATGTIGHYRIYDSAGTTCHEQGTVTAAIALATNGTTAAGNNVLNFASTTGVVEGASISGTGIPTGATVLSKTSTTVTMSAVSTAGVSSAATILFGDTSGDMQLGSLAVTSGVTAVTIESKTLTAPGA